MPWRRKEDSDSSEEAVEDREEIETGCAREELLAEDMNRLGVGDGVTPIEDMFSCLLSVYLFRII